jgi:hypothetical protein
MRRTVPGGLEQTLRLLAQRGPRLGDGGVNLEEAGFLQRGDDLLAEAPAERLA